MEKGSIVQFKGVLKKLLYEKNDFRIYSCKPEEIISGVVRKHPVYGTITFSGFMPEYTLEDVEYSITLEYEGEGKYGDSWKAVKVTRERPMTESQIKSFLSEFTTIARANVIVNTYPTIIDMIVNNEEVDYSKIKGIGKKTFEKIKKKVVENLCLAEIHAEFSKYNCFTFSMIKKLYQEYKTVEATVYKLKKEPYRALMQLDGIGFKKADEIATKIMPESKNSLQRAVAFIFFYINEIENSGHTWVGLEDIYSEAVTVIEESIGHFGVALHDDALFYDKENNRISRKSTMEKEEYIVNKLKRIHRNTENWKEIDESTFVKVDGFDLSDEQKTTLVSVKENGVTLLTARAGAGKSFSIKAVCEMLDKYDKSYALLTPTGKSSLVLKNYTERSCSTIHRFLGFDGISFNANAEERMNYDCIIIDEFGMVNIYLFYNLLLSIPSTTKLLLVFDSAQLSAIGCGNISHDLLTSKSECVNVCELTKVFRYKNGLAIVANKIRDGERFLSKDIKVNESVIIGEDNDYMFVECLEYDRIISKTLNFYKKLLIEKGASINDICVLSPKNAGNAGCGIINENIQDLLQSIKPTPCYKDEYREFHIGDKIMQLVNNYEAMVVTENKQYDKAEIGNLDTESCFNGMTGVVTHVFTDQIHVYFDEIESTILYTKDKMNTISLGFCCTIHKSQGSGYKYIILVTAKDATFMCNRNLIYTGATRAKDKLIHIGYSGMINSSLRKEESKIRNTFMKEFLAKK